MNLAIRGGPQEKKPNHHQASIDTAVVTFQRKETKVTAFQFHTTTMCSALYGPYGILAELINVCLNVEMMWNQDLLKND